MELFKDLLPNQRFMINDAPSDDYVYVKIAKPFRNDVGTWCVCEVYSIETGRFVSYSPMGLEEEVFSV